MRHIYSIGIGLYTLGIRVAAAFGHRTAKQMVQGWSQTIERVAAASADGRPTAWFHAASLGEFEQARPLIEAWRERHEGWRVVVSFFSPSGYEIRKDYPLADAVVYFTPDTPGAARRLVEAIEPSVAFFVKYDFWFNTLHELRRRHVRTYLFSAIFRPGQYFFRPWGRWFAGQLGRCFDHIFVQNEESLALLHQAGIDHCSIAADTRFDRVAQIAHAAARNATVEAWLQATGEGLVMVGGSTWPPDEQMIAEACSQKPLRLIIAPHKIDEEHLRQIEQLWPTAVRYSHFDPTAATAKASGPLLIDNMGLLSSLYRYADVAYIGGGFGAGIHNTLEAVAWGKPVLFGPNYTKFQEAHDLLGIGAAMTHTDSHSLQHKLGRWVDDAEARKQAQQACLQYMERNTGGTEKIMKQIEK